MGRQLSKAKLVGLYLIISIVYGAIFLLLYHIVDTGHYPFWLKVNTNYILGLVVLAAIVLYNWFYNRVQKRKLARSMQAQETLNLKLPLHSLPAA